MKVDKKLDSLKTDALAGSRSSKLDSSKKSKGAMDILAPDLAASAKVELSPRAQDTKKATEIARKGMNDIDEAKVQKYQALIDSGKYQVDSAKVADRMVDEHLANEFAAGDAKN
jgi:flagellar biosynthesis anti-sigma factor FlgM